ncbi:MAG: DNA-formamidopyrimidine glycosylase, partial [Gammaproteobacteria bacterium]|nr:DNA-formamidopyrimidine glycosylase [Gammaproteobacteria bacterium]
DAHTVVGVGNIYASEALFTAGINPVRAAGRVAPACYEALAAAIKTTLEKAIGFGGTTLRDFADAGGRPGYFRHELNVYGRAGEDCPRCGEAIRQRRIGQRSSFYCASCQT